MADHAIDGPTREQQMFAENEGLIWMVLRQTTIPPHVPREDAFQICAVAMARACRDFDPEKGSFSTIAVLYMKRDLWREINIWRYGKDLSVPNQEVYRRTMNTFSGFEPAFDREEEETVFDTVEQTRFGRPDAAAEARDELRKLSRRIRSLDARSAEIMERRIHGDGVADIGKDLGISKERVRQIARKSFADIAERISAETGESVTPRGSEGFVVVKPSR